MIPSRWFTDEQKENDPSIESLYFTNMESENRSNGELALVSNTSTIPKTVSPILRHAAQKKLKYGEVWGLARQATHLAIENDQHNEMVVWLKQFINRQKEVISIVTGKRDRESLINEIHEADEIHEVDDANKENENEFDQVDDTNKENEFNQVENPSVSKHRGRPATKRYKSATETKKKPRAKYNCRTCGQTGHNTARC